MTQARLALLSLCTLAFAIACGDSSGPPAVATVDVSAPGSDLQVGQTLTLTATARDLGRPGPDERYGWGLVDAAAATSREQ